jgi:hypothetical protein
MSVMGLSGKPAAKDNPLNAMTKIMESRMTGQHRWDFIGYTSWNYFNLTKRFHFCCQGQSLKPIQVLGLFFEYGS